MQANPLPFESPSTAGALAATLARAFITLPVNARLPTTAEYASRFKVGFGTIQAALGSLKDAGVIELRARGAKGTFLVGKSYARLWRAAQLDPVVGLLPVPFSVEIAGLATGISDVIRSLGVPFRLIYLGGGARDRVAALKERRADFTVLSRRAAEHLLRAEADAWRIARVLAPGTYYRADSLVVITRAGAELRRHPRIGIDLSSDDHELLTRAEFGEGAFVPVRYNQIPHLISEGSIDAAVWHRTSQAPLATSMSLHMRPLQNPRTTAISASMREAAILIPAGRPELAELLDRAVDWGKVEAAQDQVIGGSRVPEF